MLKLMALNENQLNTILGRIHEWIRAVDQKISIVLAFTTATTALTFSQAYGVAAKHHRSFGDVTYILLILGSVLAVYASLKLLFALSPRLKNHTGSSFTYFGDIALGTQKDFIKRLEKVNISSLTDDLEAQIYFSSKVCRSKHIHLRDGIWLYSIGITCVWIVSLYWIVIWHG